MTRRFSLYSRPYSPCGRFSATIAEKPKKKCQKGLFEACTQLGHHCEIAGDLDTSLQYFQGDKRRALAEWIAALRLFKQLGMERQSQAVIRAMAA